MTDMDELKRELAQLRKNYEADIRTIRERADRMERDVATAYHQMVANIEARYRAELMPRSPDRMLKADEVAELLNVRTSSLYDLVRKGNIPHVRIGQRIRFNERLLNEWVAAGGTQQEAQSP